MFPSRIYAIVVIALAMVLLVGHNEACARLRVRRTRCCCAAAIEFASTSPTPAPQRQKWPSQRPEEIRFSGVGLTLADIAGIQVAIQSRFPDRDNHIISVVAKSPGIVEAMTVTVVTPASEAGNCVKLERSGNNWIVRDAGDWIGDKMPPDRPPGP